MDLYVEKQCIDEMKSGDVDKFLLLFDATFNDVYKYVARRVTDIREVERIVRLTYLDALGRIQNTPNDIGYVIWLFSISKPRVWEYIDKISISRGKGNEQAGPEPRGDENLVKAYKMMDKLSLEEREILRLKFFEEVTDGDVMTILGIEEGVVGPKIFRVLKRAHFLMFGESEERQGVYFGELSGLFEKMRENENIEIPEVFKLSLKADVRNRIEKKNFAIEGSVIEEKKRREDKIIKNEYKKVGSDDPAKIFVEAVKEMREEEERESIEKQRSFEKKEKMYDFIDRWKVVLTLLPAILLVAIVAFVVINIFDYFKGLDDYKSTCDIEVVYEGEFSKKDKESITKGVENRLCDYFKVERLLITKTEEGVLEVEVDVPDWFLEYRFVRKLEDWRIKKYARTFNSNEKSGQV